MPNRVNRWKIGLIHIGLWALYIASEYLSNYYHLNGNEHREFIFKSILRLPILIIPTYAIIYFAIPKFLQPKKYGSFILSTVLAAVFIFYGRVKWLEWMNFFQYGERFSIPPSKVIKNVIRDYAIVALGTCLYIISDWRRKQQLNQALSQAKAEAEIQLLRGQLQPHFLFNTLNNIYSLSLMQSDQTSESILKLTALLDYIVYKANKANVQLKKEVELLTNYIDLEKLRYGDSLKLTADIYIEREATQIAPLMLLPFAENCFKHGGKNKDGLFIVDIVLREEDQQLKFSVMNSKKFYTNTPNKNGGFGLDNLQKRLELRYPNKYTLDISDESDYFKIDLKINLHE